MIQRPNRRTRAILVAGLFLLALASGAWLLDRGARTGTFTAYEAARLFGQVFDHLSTDYIDSLDDSVLYRKAVDGVLYELHDPYSVFLSPERFARLGELVSGDYAGLGIAVDIRGGSIVIVAPLPGSPAERAGIQPGDRIVRIDGKSTEGWTNEEASHALRGKPGTSVALELERPGGSGPIRVSLTRQAIHQSAVRRTAMLAGGVGYLDLKAFSDSTEREVSHAITALAGQGMRSLILDLRSNPGGLLSQGVKVSDLFLDPGQRIVTMEGRIQSANRIFTDSARQEWPELPLTVLVDGRSASAAEIVAGALQDHDRAVIIGRATYGKGSAQSVFPFGSSGGLKLTTARWYTPSGRSISKPVIDEDNPDASGALIQRQRYKTDGGRTIYGSGGISPDVVAGDTALAPSEGALVQQLGMKVGAFRDAITNFALEAKGKHSITTADFAVTPAMREDLWRRLVTQRIRIERSAYDRAEPLVSRLLEYEIARYVFGTEAEFRRRSRYDRALAKALDLSQGVKSERDLIRRASVDKASADSVTK